MSAIDAVVSRPMKSWLKIVAGSVSLAMGVVGDDQEMFRAYAQLYPLSQSPALPPPSMPICKDGNLVLPIFSPASWSADMPNLMAVCDLFACAQVMNAHVPAAWSPTPSGIAGVFSSPVITLKSGRSGSSGAKIGDIVQSGPILAPL